VELIRKFPKGHAVPPPHVPWYEAVVAYLILIPAVISWFVGVFLLVSYWSCSEASAGVCTSSDLLRSSTGSYTGIVLTAAFAYVVAICCAVAVQLSVRKLYFLLVWGMALLCLAASWFAYGVLSGLYPTPWGHLIPLS
jgi:hypothetical protein